MRRGGPKRSQEAYENWATSAKVNNSNIVGTVREKQ